MFFNENRWFENSKMDVFNVFEGLSGPQNWYRSSICCFGCILSPLRPHLGGFWAPRGLSWGPFGRPWGLLEGHQGSPEAALFHQNRPLFCIPHFGPHFGYSWATLGRHFGSPKASRTLQTELDRAFFLAYASFIFAYFFLCLPIFAY